MNQGVDAFGCCHFFASKEAPGAGDVDAATVMIVNRRGQAIQVLGQISNEEANKGWKKYSFEVDPALAQSAQMGVTFIFRGVVSG